jgi:cytoskeletal protein CcmA (bactofilin family)
MTFTKRYDLVNDNMKFGPISFSEDTELNEPVSSFGPLVARGNLYATQIKTNGPCSIGENLEISDYLKVNGPLSVKGTFTSKKEAVTKVNGPVTVSQGIIGGKLKINGPIKAKYLEVKSVKINGPVRVQEDLLAEEEIKIGLGGWSQNRLNRYLDIGGTLEAPHIQLKNYSSGLSAAGIIKKVFGLKEKYKRIATVENLKIKAKTLELEGVELVDCDLTEVGEIIDLSDEVEEF